MAYWLDYSAAKLDGDVIKRAGYTGVIRYIDSPANLGRKHTDLEEYRSHKAAGLSVLLVMQTTTTASDGGRPTGVDHAQRALAGAKYLGYAGPIFFTNDRTIVPNAGAWRAYLDGAASVLGKARTGAYGFRNAMDLAVGHATYFWQAGRRSDVAAHTHIWQDNNTQVTVGGITCDRNLILKPITPQETDMEYTDPWDDEKLNALGPAKLGWALKNIKDNVKATRSMVDTVEPKLAAIQASVAAIAKDPDIDPAELARVVDAAVKAHTPTVEQTVAALLPTLSQVIRDVMGEDNDGQADAIVDALVRRLATK